MSTTEERAERIRLLREQIEEIKRRLPKHTPSVAIMIELEEREYALRRLLAEDQAACSGKSDQDIVQSRNETS